MSPTFFGLLAEFGTAEIPLADCCGKYFGMDERVAKLRAAAQELPVPVHRGGTRKSPFLVNAVDLAAHLDSQMAAARDRWNACRGIDEPARAAT